MADTRTNTDGPRVQIPADQIEGMRAAVAANRRALGLPPQVEEKRPVVVEAKQWFKCGDHPQVGLYRMPPVNDAGDVDVDGELNGRKRHCDLPYVQPASGCTSIMHDHGWFDTGDDGCVVCPGDWVITSISPTFKPAGESA